MTSQDTIISVKEEDLISVVTSFIHSNSTSITNNVQPAATFLSFFINFPGDFSPYNAIEAFFLTVLLLLITFLTIAGNATIFFIIIYFKRFRRSNYLVISLAVSDLLVGLVVMPPAIIYQVSGDWYFGSTSCHIWLSADVLNCTASIFNLCMVSIDRFWLIMKPLKYETKRTKLRMSLYIVIIWSLAMCISLPPLLTMGNEYEEVQNGPTLCALYQHFIYQIYAIVGSFYIPLLVIIPINYKLFNAARDKSAMNYQVGRFDMELEPDVNPSCDRHRIIRSTICPRHSHNERVRPSLPETHLRNIASSTSGDNPRRHSTGERRESPMRNMLQKSIRMLSGNNQICICNRRQLRRRKSERKASTTLGIIVGAFIVCWLPFFMLALIRPFYKADDIPHSVSSLFLWLGYCNSALNPIIYAIFNKEIRKPFILIMCLRWRNINELMREEYYQRQFGERRTRNDVNGGNDGTENTERADLVDDSNLNINHNNPNIDNNSQNYNNNQNVDNNNQDVDRNNSDISNNNQDVDGNNQDVGGNNQDVANNKQDVNNKKQELDDNKIIVGKNQIVIDIVEESEISRF
ncbi:PREDICTED: 5-hydroxytryptamine receptor 1 isoform X2 [Vollenhovia emeryi]|uniref:5-hydroxytryptamine receptor 1 isoform X2 n=1 Tax=Vollenhovia emeryi TaxID=411798 RepID=UPI0005F4417A|nr:PREDICTED: 5-hydroxytryptamine receptor 1 isoform X2 [Vollenhovia emeryi]